MPHTLLSLPRELRDRIYHFSLVGTTCTGAVGEQWVLIQYGPEGCQDVSCNWVLASKQIFQEARAQFHRDPWLRSIFAPGTRRSPHCGTGGFFALCPDIARISGYSAVCRLSRCHLFASAPNIYPPNTLLTRSDFRERKSKDWAVISSIAPSLTRLHIDAFMLPNLGYEIGLARYSGCALRHESTFVPEMSFHSVEIILQCPIFRCQKFDVARLAGVMEMYEELQERLELAAIELTGSSRLIGKTIRDWTTGGGDNCSQRWHIEVRRNGKSGANERQVEHLGLRHWIDLCSACNRPGDGDGCIYHHPARRFRRVESKEGEDTSFFCATTKETVRRVNSQFELHQGTE